MITDEDLPHGDNSVNKAIRPLAVVPFKKNKHRVWLSAEFLKRTDLSAEDKGLLGVLLAHADPGGCCWPTHPQLVLMCGMGHCKLEKKLKALRKRDLITWAHFTDEYGHKRNRYHLLFLRTPTPTNELLAYPPKAVVKHIAIYSEGDSRTEETPAKYGLQA